MTRRGILRAGLAAFASPAVAAPGTGPRTLLVTGQSLAVAWKAPEVQAAFRAEAGADWRVTVAAKGGTSALPWGDGRRAWTAPDGGIGPVLALALAQVQTMPGRPDVILWSQGQADGGTWNRSAMSSRAFTLAYRDAVLFVLETLRRATAGSQWRDIPVLIQMIGWRRDPETGDVYEPPGYALVRLAQTMLIEQYGRKHNLHVGPVQTPWDELNDEVHPTTATYCRLAERAAVRATEVTI